MDSPSVHGQPKQISSCRAPPPKDGFAVFSAMRLMCCQRYSAAKMAKGSKKKRKAAAAAARKDGDEEMAPAEGGWQTKGGAHGDADPIPQSLDDFIALDAKRSKDPKPSAGVKKKEARGQKTKAQKLRKVDRLEKALAANDRYASKCTKKGQAKQMKTTLANIY
eukprot:TRINITY_DN16435_c1_g1_i1.p2 TRINITY_DN16435_c1_g1~~TRINITY_DN16435_c1_g1_i1.p2  ORF type:complete len:164 (-),score=21.68 TRINITY_DN16435_c1_g1_i1:288-779(-)